MTQQSSALRARTRYQTVEQFIESYGQFFDRYGLFVRTSKIKPPGTVIRFEFQLADGKPVFRGEGVVREQEESDLAGMYLKLTKLDRASAELQKKILLEKEELSSFATKSRPTSERGRDPRPVRKFGDSNHLIETHKSASSEVKASLKADSKGATSDDTAGLSSADLEQIANAIESSLDSVIMSGGDDSLDSWGDSLGDGTPGVKVGNASGGSFGQPEPTMSQPAMAAGSHGGEAIDQSQPVPAETFEEDVFTTGPMSQIVLPGFGSSSPSTAEPADQDRPFTTPAPPRVYKEQPLHDDKDELTFEVSGEVHLETPKTSEYRPEPEEHYVSQDALGLEEPEEWSPPGNTQNSQETAFEGTESTEGAVLNGAFSPPPKVTDGEHTREPGSMAEVVGTEEHTREPGSMGEVVGTEERPREPVEFTGESTKREPGGEADGAATEIGEETSSSLDEELPSMAKFSFIKSEEKISELVADLICEKKPQSRVPANFLAGGQAEVAEKASETKAGEDFLAVLVGEPLQSAEQAQRTSREVRGVQDAAVAEEGRSENADSEAAGLKAGQARDDDPSEKKKGKKKGFFSRLLGR